METEPDNRTTPVFEFLFKIEPAGDFGLPVEGTVVTRAREGEQIYSATLDRFTGNVVSHGSLPPYREDTEAVHIDWRFDDMQMRLHDNFLAIEMSGEDYAAVETSVLTRVDRFLQLLSLTKGTYFAAEFIQATLQTASERELVRQPRRIQLAKVQTYNLDAFKASLSWSLDAAPLATNPRLAKALDYFNHAQFLSQVRASVEFGNLNAQSHLAADIFSNFYKAASVIGRPVKRSGFSDALQENRPPLRILERKGRIRPAAQE